MTVKIRTIKDIRIYLARELINVYNDPEIKVLSDMLIKTATGITKLHQLYDNEFPVTPEQTGKIIQSARELKTGKPVQYVTGETSFYNCTIRINAATLIPRPETEELVDLILKENKSYSGEIIDFGTGSGCIAIALAVNLPDSSVTALDISEEALDVARENAILNKANVRFLKGDILNPELNLIGNAGIIVSNPPYVRNSEIKDMGKNVLDFEPHTALFVSDSEPLVFYSGILKIAETQLLPGGLIYFEMNEALGKSMLELFESFNYTELKIISDLNDKQRIIKGRKKV